MQNKPKLWTVLIYANGNNELSSIMEQAKQNLETIGSTAEINILILIGRAEVKLRKIINPTLPNPGSGKSWTGVRCYYVQKRRSQLLYKYKNLNMADPKNLYFFLKWAVVSYPALHYLLILSGHGCPLVGVMPDFCQESPFLMGLPEMCQTINYFYQETGRLIDLLILDICSMNYLEIIYELGQDKEPSVRYLLTYKGDGPLVGLPYHLIIYEMQRRCKGRAVEPVANLVKGIVSRFNLNLVAFFIDHNKCQRIKELVRKFAYTWLLYFNLQQTLDRFNTFNLSNLLQDYEKALKQELLSLALCQNSNSPSNNPLEIMKTRTENWDFLRLYSQFSFHQDNFWLHLLNADFLQTSALVMEAKEAKAKNKMKPLIMTPNMIRQYLKAVNPEFDQNKLEMVYQQLRIYKKWVDS